MSPLPISPLADPRSIDHRRGSPASLSPEHALTNSRNGADCYTSSPIDDPKRIIYDRSRSLNDRPKSPTSLRSNGTLSSKERVPFAVPPLFTDVSQLQEEVGICLALVLLSTVERYRAYYGESLVY